MSDPARVRALRTPELLLMIARATECTRSLVLMSRASKEFRAYSEQILASVFVPTLFVASFFSNPTAAIAIIRASGAVITGVSVRQYIYCLTVRASRMVILVATQFLGEFQDLLKGEAYEFVQELQLPPVDGASCASARRSYRYRRRIGNQRATHISIHTVVHHPMRALIASARAYALQAFDGSQFVDLYRSLGINGPNARLRNGTHPHLLTPREIMTNATPGMFDFSRDRFAVDTVSLERWIGDDNTWVVPKSDGVSKAPSPFDLVGWTVRLNSGLATSRPYLHLWTEAHSSCLRHSLLNGTYVIPHPALVFAHRVLEAMSEAFASGVGDRVDGVSGIDATVAGILDAYRDKRDYSFSVNGVGFQVEVAGCTYSELFAMGIYA